MSRVEQLVKVEILKDLPRLLLVVLRLFIFKWLLLLLRCALFLVRTDTFTHGVIELLVLE